jgi:hypothetical protein
MLIWDGVERKIKRMIIAGEIGTFLPIKTKTASKLN